MIFKILYKNIIQIFSPSLDLILIHKSRNKDKIIYYRPLLIREVPEGRGDL